MDNQNLLAAQTALTKKYGGAKAGDGIERHIFLCALSEKQKCCARKEGAVAWQYLKDRLKELRLAGPKRTHDHPRGEGGGIQRTKAIVCKFAARVRSRSFGRKASGITPAHHKFWSA